MNNKEMKVLRAIVLIVGLMVLVFEIFALLPLAGIYVAKYPVYETLKMPVLIFLYVTSVPFYVAIAQALKICTAVINDKPFSKENVRSFTIAKYCAVPELVLYVLAAFGLYYYTAVVKGQVLPMAVIIASVIAFCALIMSIACSVLVELLKKAIYMQEENEMTI